MAKAGPEDMTRGAITRGLPVLYKCTVPGDHLFSHAGPRFQVLLKKHKQQTNQHTTQNIIKDGAPRVFPRLRGCWSL